MLHDLKYALRQFAKAPGFTAVAILTLTLGIGACTALFSVVNSVLLSPLAYPDSGRLVVVNESKLPQFPQFSVAPANYFDWVEQSTSFESLAAARYTINNLTGMGDPAVVVVKTVTPNFFTTLRTRPILGRDFSEEEAATKARVILLSHGFWLRQFGGRPEVINQTVQLSGAAFTIIGVLPKGFESERGGDPTWAAAIYAPSTLTEQRHDRFGRNFDVIGRLKPGITLEQSRSELTLIAARLEKQYPDTNAGWGIKLTPMLESAVGDVSSMLYSLLGAVGFMLLIACANVANLLLSRATARAKEISVRLALGASRGRIVRQLLSESVLLAVLGGTLGTLAAWWGIKALVVYAPGSLPRAQEINLDARALAFTGALALLTGIGFGLVPAFQASRLNLNETLKDAGRGTSAGGRRLRARSTLVIAEVALALILLVGAGLLSRSFTRLQEVDPGFRPRDAVAVTLTLSNKRFGTPAQKTAFVAQLTARIGALHGVQSVGVINELPFSGIESSPYFNLAGQPTAGAQRQTDFCVITPEYFKAMGIPLLRGRFFSERDTASASPVAIINESMAKRFFPGRDPIGQHINVYYGTMVSTADSEIVGVVGDVKTRDLDENAKVQTYEPFAQHPDNYLSLVVRSSGATPDLPAAIRESVYSLEKGQPIARLEPLTSLLAASLVRQRFTLFLFAVFSILALVLTAIGIYGVMAYSVTQRTGEIGIRIALGAQRADVLRLISLQGGRLVALGLTAGTLGALLLTRLISSLLYGISAQDPLTFAAIAALLAAVAAIACLVPAWRATKVDPIIALRAE